MKTIARIGAIGSFTFFFFPGAMLLKHEPTAFVIGSCMIGFAFFAGTLLWMKGETCCPRQDDE